MKIRIWVTIPSLVDATQTRNEWVDVEVNSVKDVQGGLWVYRDTSDAKARLNYGGLGEAATEDQCQYFITPYNIGLIENLDYEG